MFQFHYSIFQVVFAINCKSFEVRTEVLIGSVPHAQNSQLGE